MRTFKPAIAISISALVSLSLAGCGDDDEDEAPFGTADEVSQAETLIAAAKGENYDQLMNGWELFPGKINPTTSGAPHGNGFASIFVDSTFAGSSDKANPDEDSIIIKHNLKSESLTDLDSITVMVKMEAGFDTEHKDWFWAKLSPAGEVQSNPDNIKLAGRIGSTEGEKPGCIGCHSQDANDYIVTPFPAAAFGSGDEVKKAEAVISAAKGENYDQLTNGWQLFPGTNNPTTSGAPHGDGYASIFVNSTFTGSSDKANPAMGSVIIKHNLNSATVTDIDSITVMVKMQPGYDAANKDWFWAKLSPAGAVQENPDNIKLAGRIGSTEGTKPGCIGCHSQDADYIVTAVP